MLFIVILCLFLDGYIGQVHKDVVDLRNICAILLDTKTTKATTVQEDLQWLVVGDQDIQPHVELLAPHK